MAFEEEEEKKKKMPKARAAKARAALRRIEVLKAMDEAKEAAKPAFEADELRSAAIRIRSRRRADDWREDAHAAALNDEVVSSCSSDDDSGDYPRVTVGAVVQVDGGPWDPDRVGIVTRVTATTATVRFPDAPLNKTLHPALEKLDGVNQVWRGPLSKVNVQEQDKEEEESPLDFVRISEEARADLIRGTPKNPTAHIFLAAPAEDRGDDDLRNSINEQVELERQRRVDEFHIQTTTTTRKSLTTALAALPHEDNEPSTTQKPNHASDNDETKQVKPRGSIFAGVPDEENQEEREHTRQQVLEDVERERRRRLFWDPTRARGALVDFVARGDKTTSPGDGFGIVDSVSKYFWGIMCSNDDPTKDIPGQSPAELIEQQLLCQRDLVLFGGDKFGLSRDYLF